ncbi:anti-sigma factor [Palleronia sp. KMU-117]|uniref:anti-sigma factor n=1 Tax=Palleronia sp. KMU-117 TaxID=3434108 RepID=UPI003D75DE6F
MTDATDSDEDDVLAGEYALGLMESDARAAFETRLARDPVLRGQVRAWQERLASLAAEVDPVAPPPRLKSAIEGRLFGNAPATRPGRWSWTRFLGGALTAIALVVALLLWIGPPAPGPALTAEVAAEDRSLVYAVRFEPAQGRLEVARIDGAPAEGRVHELWLIAEGASAPVSLGVLPGGDRMSLALPETLAAAMAGGTLAVSDEPPGGSPTGQPTGAVLALGTLPAG